MWVWSVQCLPIYELSVQNGSILVMVWYGGSTNKDHLPHTGWYGMVWYGGSTNKDHLPHTGWYGMVWGSINKSHLPHTGWYGMV